MDNVRDQDRADKTRKRRPLPPLPTTTPDWPKWSEMDHAELSDLVALSVGICPEAWQVGHASMSQATQQEYFDRLDVAENHLKAGKFPAVGVPPELTNMYSPVRIADFAEWVHDRGWELPEGFPPPTPKPLPVQRSGQAGTWPWGTYDTELLRHLAAAVHEFWTKYDPAKPRTAPTNKRVEDYLARRGVDSVRVREIMAQIIRADDAPRGPRPI